MQRSIEIAVFPRGNKRREKWTDKSRLLGVILLSLAQVMPLASVGPSALVSSTSRWITALRALQINQDRYWFVHASEASQASLARTKGSEEISPVGHRLLEGTPECRQLGLPSYPQDPKDCHSRWPNRGDHFAASEACLRRRTSLRSLGIFSNFGRASHLTLRGGASEMEDGDNAADVEAAGGKLGGRGLSVNATQGGKNALVINVTEDGEVCSLGSPLRAAHDCSLSPPPTNLRSFAPHVTDSNLPWTRRTTRFLTHAPRACAAPTDAHPSSHSLSADGGGSVEGWPRPLRPDPGDSAERRDAG